MNQQYDVSKKQSDWELDDEDIPVAEIEVVEDLPLAVVEQEESVLMVIEDVFHISGRGAVIVGTIQNEPVSVGESVMINNNEYAVSALEYCKKMIKVASCGMIVGILLKGAGKRDFKRGDLVFKKL